jgi:hypothetical protein
MHLKNLTAFVFVLAGACGDDDPAPGLRDAALDARPDAVDAQEVVTDARQEPADAAPLTTAALCTATGGSVGVGMCCASTQSFPDTCLIGACGCAPANSRSVELCECPSSQCFDPRRGCLPRFGCTPGSDQTCNASPSISSLHGHCNADGSCTCGNGFQKDPLSGRCL